VGGLIGLNLICNFLGESIDAIVDHVLPLQLHMGYEIILLLALTFFYEEVTPIAYRHPHERHFF